MNPKPINVIIVSLLILLGLLYMWQFKTPYEQDSMLLSKVGQKTSISGLAQDSKAAAVIVDSQGNSIYIRDVDYWPKGIVDEKITANGMLSYENYIPGDKQFVLTISGFTDEKVNEKMLQEFGPCWGIPEGQCRE